MFDDLPCMRGMNQKWSILGEEIWFRICSIVIVGKGSLREGHPSCYYTSVWYEELTSVNIGYAYVFSKDNTNLPTTVRWPFFNTSIVTHDASGDSTKDHFLVIHLSHASAWSTKRTKHRPYTLFSFYERTYGTAPLPDKGYNCMYCLQASRNIINFGSCR